MAKPPECLRSGSAALALLSALLLVGCASAPQRIAAPAGPRIESPGTRAAGAAAQMVGTPYRFGGADPAGFDCSGLVHYAYRQAGISVPRSTELQHRASSPIPLSEARGGDLLFFNPDGKVSHVGIYIGDGRFVHAPSTGKSVQLASLQTDYFRRFFVGAGRVVAAAR
jgi:cell wall-associated NlpC family hydrolase